MVCYIRKYVIILGGGDIPVDVPPNQNIGGDVSPASPAALTPVEPVPIWILMKQETVSGSGISWAIGYASLHLAPDR